ncbi:MAG: transcription-repair coupling factor, partial [Planctomycetota bacterium]
MLSSTPDERGDDRISDVNPLSALQKDPRFEHLADRLREQCLAAAEGLWGSAGAVIAGLLAEALQRPLLYVAAHADDADDARDVFETACGWSPDLLPQLETLHRLDPDDELFAERLRLCMALAADAEAAVHDPHSEPRARRHIATSIYALMQPVPAPDELLRRSLFLTAGQTLPRDTLRRWLEEHEFRFCDQVELPGDCSVRGGIVDIFGLGQRDPVRIEFFDDRVESLRIFDAGTQRSSKLVQSIRIPGFGGDAFDLLGDAASDATTGFLSYLPPETLIVFDEPADIQEIGRTLWRRLGEARGVVPADAVFRRANDFKQLHLRRFVSGDEHGVEFPIGALPQFEAKSAEALATLRDLAESGPVYVFCANLAERQRFAELIAEQTRDSPVHAVIGALSRGFRWERTSFVPHHELFRRQPARRTLRRVQPARPIDSFFDLNPGDYVVHVTHGIGRFRGLQTLERNGRSNEFLVVEFADEAVVHVPTSQVQLVQKYIGGLRGGKPRLSKLGAGAWKRTKARVEEAVTDLAAELIALQAERETKGGVAYPRDTTWQREFDGAFPFTETQDQLVAIEEIKNDLIRPRPMDRLVCGDVGFGKTELAMRAAFKVVEYGKQVAVLVPTTVLAEQHYHTFRERMADYPFEVEVLSRFRTAAEQRKIVQRAREGRIDILIGTHRLLSNDVRFADLGLVVIDEEQRFGVEAKESLKRLRASVDVLTLSATPIPRTLHMSLLGIRDISSLATPPLDRRAIVTQVRMWNDELVRDAILRELNRDGQVYFVHNFVRDIESVAERVRQIAPEARVVVGHGQMKGHELEDVMLKFMRREADVLVSTNIIESGLDIPSANTIFIHRAERFGLADLHQLRGRVGRSKHRAYCYLLLSPKHPVKDTAAKRLKAIEHYSDLGAGFQIAMRDLEIRGAGNILGPEQSGHIEAVGYELYCQLLEQAVRRQKNEPSSTPRMVNLDIGVTASIPKTYIAAQRQRMEVYKRLAAARTIEEIAVLRDDLRDAFGESPAAVEMLLQLAEIRVLAQRWG